VRKKTKKLLNERNTYLRISKNEFISNLEKNKITENEFQKEGEKELIEIGIRVKLN
jgi:hypothetical protein